MKTRLRVAEGPAKGVVLEVKEEQGLGHTIDVIIYDGILKRNDTILLGGINGVITTKVRNIFVPAPLQDMRIAKSGFRSIDEVVAAAGVKISAPGLEEALAGSPLYSVDSFEKIEEFKKSIEEEMSQVRFSKNISGIVVKADSLGSLESLVAAFERLGIPVRVADIGPISKRDVMEAELSGKESEELNLIAAFRVKVLPGLDVSKVKIIYSDIIYQLIDEVQRYLTEVRERKKRRTLDSLILPGKIKLLPGYVFRRSDPVIVGVQVLGGIIRPKYPLMKEDGKRIGEVLGIQDNKKNVDKATAGMEVALSIRGNIMVGRHIQEGEVLYTDIPADDLETLFTNFREVVTDDMLQVVKEIIKIKRTENPLYGATIQL